MRIVAVAFLVSSVAALQIKEAETEDKPHGKGAKGAKMKAVDPNAPAPKKPETIRDHWCEMGRVMPSVHMLGAQKAGSTSLYKDLIRRFQLQPASVLYKEADWMAKEVSFFADDKRFNRGRHFYLKHYPLCTTAGKWVRSLDASIALDHGEAYVNRLADFYGDKAKEIKFIVIVRDPVRRMESEFHHGEEMIGNEDTTGKAGAPNKVQSESKFEQYVLKQLAADGDATKWKASNRTEDPPQYFKGSSYAFMLKHWLKRFNPDQFIILTLKQYQTRTADTLKYLGKRLGMGVTDSTELFEHVFANENKNKHPPLNRTLERKLEKYFEELDEEFKTIITTNHMGLEDETEMKLTKGKPASAMWMAESSSPRQGRKIDQEWWGGPGKIYGNGVSFIQKAEANQTDTVPKPPTLAEQKAYWQDKQTAPAGNKPSSAVQKAVEEPTPSTPFTAQAKAHVFVINTVEKVDKCHCISAQMADSEVPYSSSRLIGSNTVNMYTQCSKVPKLKELAHRIGTRNYAGTESALFCSNYRAWQEALANHTDKEYIIIMEDDVHLNNPKEFWQKVDGFLHESNTNCQGWDHMNVDPYEGAFKQNNMCPGIKISNPTQSGGAHMQIIRREKLQELVNFAEKHGAGLVDRFADWMPKSIRKFSWKAQIVQQFNTKGRQESKRPQKPGFCTDDVFKHQVSLLQDGKAEQLSPDLKFMKASGKKLAFSCENF